jgi:hypothetical protein
MAAWNGIVTCRETLPALLSALHGRRGRSCMASLRKAAARKGYGRKQQAPVPLPAERARIISSAAARRSRSRAAADDAADTSSSAPGSSYAPSTAGGAPEPGGAAGSDPRAGGASHFAACGAAGPWMVEEANSGCSSCCLSAPGLCCAL